MKTKNDVLLLVLISLLTVFVMVYSYIIQLPDLFAVFLILSFILASTWIDTINKIRKGKLVVRFTPQIVHHYQLGNVQIVENYNNGTALVKSSLTNNVYNIKLKDTDH